MQERHLKALVGLGFEEMAGRLQSDAQHKPRDAQHKPRDAQHKPRDAPLKPQDNTSLAERPAEKSRDGRFMRRAAEGQGAMGEAPLCSEEGSEGEGSEHCTYIRMHCSEASEGFRGSRCEQTRPTVQTWSPVLTSDYYPESLEASSLEASCCLEASDVSQASGEEHCEDSANCFEANNGVEAHGGEASSVDSNSVDARVVAAQVMLEVRLRGEAADATTRLPKHNSWLVDLFASYGLQTKRVMKHHKDGNSWAIVTLPAAQAATAVGALHGVSVPVPVADGAEWTSCMLHVAIKPSAEPHPLTLTPSHSPAASPRVVPPSNPTHPQPAHPLASCLPAPLAAPPAPASASAAAPRAPQVPQAPAPPLSMPLPAALSVETTRAAIALADALVASSPSRAESVASVADSVSSWISSAVSSETASTCGIKQSVSYSSSFGDGTLTPETGSKATERGHDGQETKATKSICRFWLRNACNRPECPYRPCNGDTHMPELSSKERSGGEGEETSSREKPGGFKDKTGMGAGGGPRGRSNGRAGRARGREWHAAANRPASEAA